jgi:integrase
MANASEKNKKVAKPRRAKGDGGLHQKQGLITNKITGERRSYTYWQAVKEIASEELPEGVERKRITGSGETKSEAKARLDANIKQYHQTITEELARPKRRRKTAHKSLEEWSEKWLHDMEFGTRVGETMRGKYRGTFRLHINPHIGNIPLRELNSDHLNLLFWDTLINIKKIVNGKKTDTPLLSEAARLNIYKALSACLNSAIKNDLIFRNPIILVESPRPQRHKDDVDKPSEDAIALMKAMAKDQHEDYCRFLLQFLGLRRSERLGLSWSKIKNLQTNKATLVIDQQLARHTGKKKDKKFNEEHGWYIYPRTKAKPREIVIPEPFLSALREYKKTQDKLKKSSQWKPQPEFADLLFLQKNGEIITPNRDNNDWIRLLSTYKLPYWRGHLNRHITATWLAALKPAVPMATVKQILGHSEDAMYYYYAKAGVEQQHDPLTRYGIENFSALIGKEKMLKIKSSKI